MIKIYDEEPFVINIEKYDRNEILQMCWKESNCSKRLFLLMDKEKIVGGVSYFNILYDDEIPKKVLKMNKETLFA